MRKKRIVSLLIAMSMMVSLIGNNVVSAEEDLSTIDNQINAIKENEILRILDSYFTTREECFYNHKTIKETYNNTLNLSETNEVLSDFEKRSILIGCMADRMNIDIVGAETEYGINEINYDEDSCKITVYEWNWVEYKGVNGYTDKFGYGVIHNMSLDNENGQMKIKEDIYDEGPITLMSSSVDIRQLNNIINIQKKSDEIYELALDLKELTNEETQILPFLVNSYNPYEAIYYSDKYVKHTSGIQHTTYDSYYNPDYPNFNLSGGDCANYVSQCLRYGGVPMDSITSNSGWWYNPVNRTCSAAWSGAISQYNYFSSSNVSYSDASAIQIVPGNPVYYDFDGGTIDHATICVGYNSSGVPIINSHNYDQYHVPWTYAGTNATVYTVRITADDVLDTISGAATVNEGNYYAKLDTTVDKDCFKFVASSGSRSYTIKTTGTTNTNGILYSSSGELLAYNDDGGDGNNFSITYNLTQGSVYYITVGSTSYSSGFYSLNIS